MIDSKIQWTDQSIKRCYKCKEEKPRSLFSIDRSRYDGRKAKCIACCRVKVRACTKGRVSTFKGKKHPQSAIERMRINNAGCGNPNWKGGITPLLYAIRNTAEYSKWRMDVYHAGKFTCSACGARKVGENIILDADHIRPLALLVHENGITSVEQAVQCSALFEVSNGRCLCRPCHKETPTWGVNIKLPKIKCQY